MHSKHFKVAIVGLSLTNMHALRAVLVACTADKFSLDWVNAADPDIDLLIIDIDFFDSSSIQRIIHSKHIPYLKIDRTRKDIADQQILDSTISFPVVNTSMLANWLVNTLTATPSSNVSKSAVLTSNQLIHVDSSVEKKTSDFYVRFHEKNNGLCKIIASHGLVGVFDQEKDFFWPSLHDHVKHLDSEWGISYATQADKSKTKQTQMSLKHWLWSLLNQDYQILEKVCVERSTYFELISWPKIAKSDLRKDVYLICSFLNQAAMTIEMIEKKTNMDSELLLNLTKRLLIAGFIRQVDAAQVPLVSTISENTVDHAVVKKGWKGMLSKLRNQFGL